MVDITRIVTVTLVFVPSIEPTTTSIKVSPMLRVVFSPQALPSTVSWHLGSGAVAVTTSSDSSNGAFTITV